jgi:hypothetical protein
MLLKWRLTEVWEKTLYIVIGYAVVALLFFVLRTWLLDGTSWQYAVIGLLINLAFVLVAVRTFRGYLEPAAPPRPWWRWSGRPKAGYWLGTLNLLVGVTAIQDFWPRHGLTPDVPVTILNILESAIVAFGYLNSSFRLRQQPELWSQRRRQSAPPLTTNR